MEILHVINLNGAKVDFEIINLRDIEKRNSLVSKTPTTTFHFWKQKKEIFQNQKK